MATKSEVSVILSNLNVLDCKVCNQPLTIPVFQCKNGHTSCKSCCERIAWKCVFCQLVMDIKCCHLEEIIRSHKLPCPNKDYGCKELNSYCNTKDHAKNCVYKLYPCPNKKYGCKELINYCNSMSHGKNCVYESYSCPEPACQFKGLSSVLSDHLFAAHPLYYKSFDYDASFSLELGKNQKIFVLKERQSSDLFVLNNEASTCGGTKISVSFVSLTPPISRKEVAVELAVGSDVFTFSGVTPAARSISDKSQPPPLLHISSGFLGSKDTFSVNLKIHRCPVFDFDSIHRKSN